jgi:hypothetical protein
MVGKLESESKSQPRSHFCSLLHFSCSDDKDLGSVHDPTYPYQVEQHQPVVARKVPRCGQHPRSSLQQDVGADVIEPDRVLLRPQPAADAVAGLEYDDAALGRQLAGEVVGSGQAA